MSYPKISVCIQCYEMHGVGDIYLKHNLEKLSHQNFQDFEVIISDQSANDKIKFICENFQDKLNLKYYQNLSGKKQCAANTNFAMTKATGSIIKIILQDDYLFTEDALLKFYNTFKSSKISWCISACEHSNDGTSVFRPFYPFYNQNIQFGKNTISSPSVLGLRRKNYLKFDENLIYLTDVDLYKRYFDRDGLPLVINDILVVNRLHNKQVSQMTPKSLIRSELHYIKNKFRNQMNVKSWLIYLKRVLKTYF